jgi:serine/threonine-protein kinase
LPDPPRDPPPDKNRPVPEAEVTFSNSPLPGDVTLPMDAGATPKRSPSAAGLVQPGNDFGWRYHIESSLGEGGMGSVYKAYDRELDRMVALKVIRPTLVADPSAVQRFKQELLLGSKVSHRNILRIHDLGDVDGMKFISMAFVDGEDLHSMLRREGRLPIHSAVRIAHQITEALAAAHAEGVVHRDLKPHNILIDRAGTAFVSDFGLAKSLALSAAPGVTRTGELLGTPRYMAPEQVEGLTVDHRVDLYALGLILYEMVTGTVPFQADSAIQELLQRVRVRAPDPRAVNAETPGPLADVILRCLERNPDARFQSADEILGALEAMADPATLSASSRRRNLAVAELVQAPPAPSVPPPTSRRLMPIAAAVLTVALVAGLAAWFGVGRALWRTAPVQPAPTGAPTPGATAGPQFLAVLPFRVLGDPQQLRYVGDGVVEALSSRLFQLGSVRVVPGRDLQAAGNNVTIEDAARKFGARQVVEGTVQGAGDRLRLVVNLHDTATGKQTWSRTFTGTNADLFTLEDDIYDGLVKALGVAADPAAVVRSAVRPTDDIEAYDLYLKGRDALRSGQDMKQLEASIDFFERAIRRDAGFPLAYAGLSDASLQMYSETKNGFWAERARAAALRARELDERLPEVHYALGSVYSGTGRNAEAVVALRRALELAPNSDEAYRRLGAAYRDLGRKGDALDAVQKAVNVNPYFWVNHNELGQTYLHFGETGQALKEFERVTELEPNNPVGYGNIGSTYFTQGEWEKGIPAYEHSLKLQPHWLTYSSLGTAYFYLKRYPEAVKAFEQAAALNPNDAITVGNLADGLRWSGDRDRARAIYMKAIALATKDLQVNPRDSTTLSMVALYHAKTGNAVSATEFIRKARAVDPDNPAILYYEAVVDTLGGREAAALTALDKALKGGYSAREAAEDPELQSLGTSEVFGQLLRRYSAQSK